MTILNHNLIKKQNLSISRVTKLYIAHDELSALLSKDCPIPDSELAHAIESQEYKLQRLWGFAPDRDWHKYWYRTERCTCPKMDNDDLIGVWQRWFASDCKLHSQRTLET